LAKYHNLLEKKVESRNIYSKILVTLQFGIAGIMLLFSSSMLFTSIFPLGLLTVGIAIGIWAITRNRLGNFNIQPELKEGSTLVTTGIYKYIRHPMYTSVLFIFFAIFTASPTILEGILFVSLVVVLLLKAKREEGLWLRHDSEYEAYKNSSKYFIPFVL
jgi:protein-S-isoprenylcysteine O-methyltransferase Ste14